MEDYRDISKEWRQRAKENFGGYHLADRPVHDPELTETGPEHLGVNIGVASGFPFACLMKLRADLYANVF